MSNIKSVLDFLGDKEIDYRLESNFCCGFIFYFLDGSVYPRRYLDAALEEKEIEVVAETTDHIVEKLLAYEIKKDWRHRIEEQTLELLFDKVSEYLSVNYNYNPS